MPPETDWIEYLCVENRAQSESSRFRVQDLCYDYMDPPIAHRLDVQVPETAAPSTAESLPADLEPGQKLALLSRSEHEVAVAETETVRPMFSSLFPDPDAEYSPSIWWEEPGVIRAFMNSVGFRRIESTKRLEEEIHPEDYSPPGPLFYRQITDAERTSWLEGNVCLFPGFPASRGCSESPAPCAAV